MVSDKQQLEITQSYYVWNGQQYLRLDEIMLQPKGVKYYMVETTHMSGTINGRSMISEEERNRLMNKTYEHLNS